MTRASDKLAARLHAEELAKVLKEALEELDVYYLAEYGTDHPYHQNKLARARASWDHARALISKIALAEMVQAGEEDGLLDEERKDDMITDHDKIDLSHQTVPQDPDYPLKGQMPGRDDNYPLRAQMPPSAASKTNMTVRLTRMDRRRDGEKHEDLRVRTQSGISALKTVGECMQAGATVAMKTWYDEAGDEWMEATLDWSTGHPAGQ